MKVLELQQLQKSFGDNQVLKGIDLYANKGDVISIIGSSGSGKSTMLRCINFLESPNSGTTTITGLNNLGDYIYTWTNEYCEESITIQVIGGDLSLITDSIDILGNCDNDGINSQTYDLTQTITQFTENPQDYSISYYETETGAQTENNSELINVRYEKIFLAFFFLLRTFNLIPIFLTKSKSSPELFDVSAINSTS